jgi:hypothetical protein
MSAACAVQPSAPPVLSTTTPPPPTLTPTPSPVWFPPTETPTPLPTLAPRPTEDLQPALAEIILSDDFGPAAPWQLFSTEAGRATLGPNELTLAVASPRAALASLRRDNIPADFYLEIDALPSLCNPSDIFGLLFRAVSSRDGYRLLASCGGQLRLERLKNGEQVLLQDWTPSGEIPPGGMVPVRLGVWASGPELRVFVNQVYQFSARDPVWGEGQVGVYARAFQDGPLTVNFSALEVRALDPARLPTPTPLPTAAPGE